MSKVLGFILLACVSTIGLLAQGEEEANPPKSSDASATPTGTLVPQYAVQGEIISAATRVFKGAGVCGYDAVLGMDDKNRVVLKGDWATGSYVISEAINHELDRIWSLTNGVYIVRTASTGVLKGCLDGSGKAEMKEVTEDPDLQTFTVMGEIQPNAMRVFVGKSVSGVDVFVGFDKNGQLALQGQVTKDGTKQITWARNTKTYREWFKDGDGYRMWDASAGVGTALDATGKKK